MDIDIDIDVDTDMDIDIDTDMDIDIDTNMMETQRHMTMVLESRRRVPLRSAASQPLAAEYCDAVAVAVVIVNVLSTAYVMGGLRYARIKASIYISRACHSLAGLVLQRWIYCGINVCLSV